MSYIKIKLSLYYYRHKTEGMEGSIPYIEIVPCKEEDPTNDEMNLRGKLLFN